MDRYGRYLKSKVRMWIVLLRVSHWLSASLARWCLQEFCATFAGLSCERLWDFPGKHNTRKIHKEKNVRFHQLTRSIWLCQSCSTSQTCLPVSTYSETLNISQLYINRPGGDCDSWSAPPMSTFRINGSRSRSPFTWLFVHFNEFAYIASVDVVVAFEPVYKSCMKISILWPRNQMSNSFRRDRAEPL